MSRLLTRRQALAGALSLPFVSRALAAAPSPEAELADLERRSGGRLGVSVLDLGSIRRFGYRPDERFAMCSTFKLLAAGYVLARVDRGEERLDRRIVVRESDLVPYAPAVEKRLGGDGMTMSELCDAAITLSDNAAANLILASYGGPAGLTAYLRSIGDDVTRLDRNEPTLNEATPGDPRDTTSPAAILDTTRKLVLGDALSASSREQLKAWLIANTTGGARIRAGVPKDWIVGDKTGTGDKATSNDVAVLWPPGREPVLLTVYFTGSALSRDTQSKVIADAASIVVRGL
ncbi:class A beta-lactamase [Flaviflagellibacter deserti]|uniref:Beta-lactamase n=1 Tax=Flaviflagellibacter deserti TaxID=2267266 RepID=A0ABV9Z4H0_9HYPH